MIGLLRSIKRLRPNSRLSEAIALVGWKTVAGWYTRKASLATVRGLISAPTLGQVRLPFFLGTRCSISYRRRVFLGRGVSIGANSRILAMSDHGVRLGDSVTIRENAWIQCTSNPLNPGVGLTIERGTYIGPGVVIGVGGEVHIGEDCQIGAGVTIIAENHAVEAGKISPTLVTRTGVSIGDGVWIGHRATILDGVTLGSGCIVGAGAVVTRSFPEGSVVVGVPARSQAEK